MIISELMEQSKVKFGTSGARGLAEDITDFVAYSYTRAFLAYMQKSGQLDRSSIFVALGGDLRPSTTRIMTAAAQAVIDCGFSPINCGLLPSPALALYSMRRGICSVMVTGSHIPEDRNGIKYTTPEGEISKEDENGIKQQSVEGSEQLFDQQGMLISPPQQLPVDQQASRSYVERYQAAFPAHLLKECRIGLYEHSAVGRDLLAEIYTKLGAEVVHLGRSETFVPVDTEAIREEDCRLAAGWAAKEKLDAIVSTDGDSDRPLIADEQGKWLRGDVCGILTADFLKADGVVTPVSCNTALERCGRFPNVLRTRIGSPFVISGMNTLVEKGAAVVVGYEANGGFLLSSDLVLRNGRELPALPTRDAVIVHLAVLSLAIAKGVPVSALTLELPRRVTASDRIKEFPTERSAEIIAELAHTSSENCFPNIDSVFGPLFGELKSVDVTDGLRMTFAGDQIVHLRPSGNAPEFRCYTEAADEQRACEILAAVLSLIAEWRNQRGAGK